LPGGLRPVGTVPGPGEEAPVPANPYANDLKAIQDGRTLFVRMNCSGCHGGRGGGGMGPSLRDPTWRYGSKPSDIFDSIAQGRGMGMPAWGTKLPQQQIWMIVSYIQSIGSDREPEAP
jgi:cytochrome c oxidase cbb3-type subunit 3